MGYGKYLKCILKNMSDVWEIFLRFYWSSPLLFLFREHGVSNFVHELTRGLRCCGLCELVGLHTMDAVVRDVEACEWHIFVECI